MSPKKIALSGVPGRMAQRLCEVCSDSAEVQLCAALVRPNSHLLGQSLRGLAGFERAPISLRLCSALDSLPIEQGPDVIIDFSSPAGAMSRVHDARHHRAALMVGTTGLSLTERAELEQLSREVPVLIAANTSLGVNLLRHLVREVAARLDLHYDIEIVEAHHRWKRDAPSGTAKLLAEAAAEGRGQVLDEVASYGRVGRELERRVGEIGIHALRLGDVVGEHRVVFSSPGERIELAHVAHSRDTFARGALRAAIWLAGQPAGLYSMDQVLERPVKTEG